MFGFTQAEIFGSVLLMPKSRISQLDSGPILISHINILMYLIPDDHPEQFFQGKRI